MVNDENHSVEYHFKNDTCHNAWNCTLCSVPYYEVAWDLMKGKMIHHRSQWHSKLGGKCKETQKEAIERYKV